jgi:hypothetical protein
LIGLASVLDASPDVTQQVIGVIEVVAKSDAQARCSGCAVGVCTLVKQLNAELEFWQHLVGKDGAGQATILATEAKSAGFANAMRTSRP